MTTPVIHSLDQFSIQHVIFKINKQVHFRAEMFGHNATTKNARKPPNKCVKEADVLFIRK